MKNAKRIVAALLASSMVLGMSVTTFAAGTTVGSKQGTYENKPDAADRATVKITGITGSPTVTLYQICLLYTSNYYLIIGGMPECVVAWMESKDPRQVSQIQEELITVYENDFSKHNGKINSGRILMAFWSIVTQLAKENEKFIYGVEMCIRDRSTFSIALPSDCGTYCTCHCSIKATVGNGKGSG